MKSLEKMTVKNKKDLKVLFTGYMSKYTMVFNEVKRSSNGKESDAYNKILDYEGELCYIPTGIGCFKKCLEHIEKTDFSSEYKEFLSDSNRCKNIMTFAKVAKVVRNTVQISVFSISIVRRSYQEQ